MVNMKKIIVGLFYALLSFVMLLPILGIIMKGLNLKIWIYILNLAQTYNSLLITFLIILITIVINIFIGTPVAFFMAKEKFKGKIVLEGLIALPLIIPTMVSAMGLQYAFIKLGLIESVMGVSIVHSIATIPYYIQSMRIGYMTLNKDYISFGKIMGANKAEIFIKIVLPLIYPSFLLGISLIIIVSLAQYLITFIIGGGAIITLPILMMPYLVNGDITNGAVYSIIYVVFTYCLVFLLEKTIKKIYRKRDKNDRDKEFI